MIIITVIIYARWKHSLLLGTTNYGGGGYGGGFGGGGFGGRGGAQGGFGGGGGRGARGGGGGANRVDLGVFGAAPKRRKTEGGEKKARTCGLCKQPGHNRNRKPPTVLCTNNNKNKNKSSCIVLYRYTVQYRFQLFMTFLELFLMTIFCNLTLLCSDTPPPKKKWIFSEVFTCFLVFEVV